MILTALVFAGANPNKASASAARDADASASAAPSATIASSVRPAVPTAAIEVQAAPPPERLTVKVDLEKITGPTNRMFQECVGAGRANEGLRADWQRQLATAHRECGFKYIRMHGLFNGDMGVYQEDKEGKPIYNWQYIDSLYDALLQIGMKPFVEVGFMPDALASGTQTCFWWRGNVTLPKDWQKWQDFVRATVAHWTERYGAQEVKSWWFEIWNEPNLNFFFAGGMKEYFKLYASTCHAIKDVNPAYRVGGPATAGCGWIQEFLDYCKLNKVPVDFVSTHTYGVGEGFVDATGTKGTILDSAPDSIARDVIKVRAQMVAAGFGKLPLHFTEWSASYTPSDPVHDSYHSAAFIVDRLRQTGGAAQSMSYWVFTDIFEEAGPRMTPFHGGFGLLNTEGVKKPAYYAYQMLNRLGDIELQCDDRTAWVTKTAKGGIEALLWDYTYTHPGKINNQEFYIRDLPPKKSKVVTFTVANLKPGRYALKLYRVGYRSNDAFTTYLDMGKPSQLSREQVDYLESANAGNPVDERIVTVGADGTFSRDCTVRENDLCEIELLPL